MFKCAIVGVSGGRARGHAQAYEHVERGQLACISTRNEENLNAFGDEFGVAARYTDYREMFELERPDLVHVNTPPDVRLEIMMAAEYAGVPALIVEKPLAIQGEDYAAIRGYCGMGRCKVAINHQLHFHPRRAALQKLVLDGGIGPLRFIDASARMNLAYQGTHSLQAIGAFNPAKPVSVFGQVAGAKGLEESPRKHFAPDQSMAAIAYENGVNAVLRCGKNAPAVGGREKVNESKRIAVYGERGYVAWSMWDWETFIDGAHEGGEHDYRAEDVLGQAAMTEAMFDWLLDDDKLHPLNLDLALQDFEVILAMYVSALRHRVVDLPFEPEPDLIESLRAALAPTA